MRPGWVNRAGGGECSWLWGGPGGTYLHELGQLPVDQGFEIRLAQPAAAARVGVEDPHDGDQCLLQRRQRHAAGGGTG